MSFGGSADRLAFLIDANPDSAIRAFKKTGDAAEKELGKAQSSIDKTGAKFRSGGAAMVAFGVVAVVGLAKMAHAAGEAETVNTKLGNSVANNSHLASAGIGPWDELATAIEHKTAADDETIKSAISVAAGFGLTADQLTVLTPLIVDYSRKTGTDMDTAAKNVAKSVGGMNTTLTRSLGPMDKAAFAADHFGATVDFLTQKVGGYAEAEGKTFEGQLARTKNILGDVAEGVGVGVVQAFGNVASVVDKVSTSLDHLSPGLKSGIGEWGTYAAAGLATIGVVSTVVGWIIKARTNVVKAAQAVKLLTVAEEGEAIAATGAGLAVLGLAAVVGVAAAAYYGITHQTTMSIDALKASKAPTADLVEVYSNLAGMFGNVGAQQQFFTQLAEGSIGTAQRLRDALAAQGVDVSELDKIIQAETASQKQANADAEAGSEVTGELTEETKDYATALADAKKRLDDYKKALEEQLGGIEDSWKAQLDLNEATLNYTTTLKDGEATLDDKESAALRVMDANVKLGESEAKAAGATYTAQMKTYDQITALQGLANSLAPGSALRVYLEQLIGELENFEGNYAANLSVYVDYPNGKPSIGTGGAIPVATGFQGTVSKPTLFLVGEGGEPEDMVVVPHSKGGIGGMSGKSSGAGPVSGGGTVVNITVNAGLGTDGHAVGRQLVEILNKAGFHGFRLDPDGRRLIGA